MIKQLLLLLTFSFWYTAIFAQAKNIKGPLPSKQQLAWHNMEYYWFAHFGPNTFTGKEWGQGDEKEEIFNPEKLDCRQWCRLAKAAGAAGIIITAKHHDGFCLWPSKFSTHTVRESKWRNGKGDVVKELSDACKEYGLKFGVYISPWDRNHPLYGTDEYNDVFVNMMKELFTNYGPIWELWWDGANGEGPNGKKQVYDWKRYEKLIRELSPQTVIFSDIGPDCRWVGNESGFAGTTNWNYLDTTGFKRGEGGPPQDTLNSGNRFAKNWIPAECDVSIRPGWFYHKEEDDKVKSPAVLFDLYLKSVGRGANLLLNVPPDGNGLINSKDSIALMGFKQIRDDYFRNDLLKTAQINLLLPGKKLPAMQLSDGDATSFVTKNKAGSTILVKFAKPTVLNCIVLQEAIQFGQTIADFLITLSAGKEQQEIKGTTIGKKRIITFREKKITQFSISFPGYSEQVLLSEVAAFLLPIEIKNEK